MFSVEKFIEGMTVINSNSEIMEESLVLYRKSFNHIKKETKEEEFGSIKLELLQDLSRRLTTQFQVENEIMYGENIIEVAFIPQGRLFIRDEERFLVNEKGIMCRLSEPSKEYIFAFICQLANLDVKYDRPTLFDLGENKIISTLEELGAFLRLKTIRIETCDDYNKKGLDKLLNSYLFNVAYNYDIRLATMKLKNERYLYNRKKGTGQLIPYKDYNKNLVNYFYQGITTNMPFTQYLAFYHVAESFFQTISQEEINEEIKSIITRPSFRPYERKDIEEFYNRIRKKMRAQRDDGVWDEKEALFLCLKRYIKDLDSLKNAINSIDVNAISYYQKNSVEFADNVPTIDFHNTNDDTYISIRNRVYAVRNAIVHSKEGEKLRYQPFIHDKQLAREVPLIRAIAEEIIINDAKLIKD